MKNPQINQTNPPKQLVLQNQPLGIRELSESSVAVSATEKMYQKENRRKHNFPVVEKTLEQQQEGQGQS